VKAKTISVDLLLLLSRLGTGTVKVQTVTQFYLTMSAVFLAFATETEFKSINQYSFI